MKKNIFNIKAVYLILIILLAIPSIIHIINSGFILGNNEYFHIFINNTNLANNVFLNGMIYFGFFVIMFIIYFIFLKNKNNIFKNIKNLIAFIIVISILFAIILPISSSDVLSYATTGEIQSTYGANPYYEKIADIKSEHNTEGNEILNSITIWDDQLVIYGPLWSLICSIITFFSFSKVSVALILFKTLAIVIHVLNCVLIYKMTKKKFWVIFYGLNPYILFETITNVHNDLYLIFFTLLGLYFLIKKKNLLVTLIFLACATCIKYITVLLVPIILMYYYRKENVGKRILKCIKSGLLFSIFVIIMYLIYLRNIEMLFYVFIQQAKFRESIWTALLYWIGNLVDVKIILKIVTIVFIVIYVAFAINLLLKKDIKFRKIMQKWDIILLIFILGYISNLCVWYFVWLFATAMWQNAKNIRAILYVPLLYELLVSKYFFLGVEWVKMSYGFAIVTIIFLLIILNIDKIKKLKIVKKLNNVNIN